MVAEDRGVKGHSWLNPATQMLAHHRLGEWVFPEQRSPLARRTGQFVYRILYAYVHNVLGFEVEAPRVDAHVSYVVRNWTPTCSSSCLNSR